MAALIVITTFEPWVTLMVVGRPISFLIDTGATYSALPEYRELLQWLGIWVVGIDSQVSQPLATSLLQ